MEARSVAVFGFLRALQKCFLVARTGSQVTAAPAAVQKVGKLGLGYGTARHSWGWSRTQLPPAHRGEKATSCTRLFIHPLSGPHGWGSKKKLEPLL